MHKLLRILVLFFIYLWYYEITNPYKGGVFIRTTIRELEVGTGIKVGLPIMKGFIFPEGKKRIRAKGGELIERGGDRYLLLNGCSFGGGTPTASIAT